MQLKKKLLIVIGIMLLLGIGGKMYVDHQKVKEQEVEAEKIEAERMSVRALKRTFKDIKSVEFEKSALNKMTGSYSMVVKMTALNGEFVTFDYLFSTNRPDKIGGWGVIDTENVQKKGRTKTSVTVVYTNGSEEEV